MNIKRIIREELEGYKDSSEEDWEWSNEGEFTVDGFIDLLDEYDVAKPFLIGF